MSANEVVASDVPPPYLFSPIHNPVFSCCSVRAILSFKVVYLKKLAYLNFVYLLFRVYFYY